MLVTFPPETSLSDTSVDPQLMGMEYLEKLPGLAETFDPAEAGMHVTPTLDYGVVLQGEIGLLLDNGEIKHLKQHDVVIQTGTRHAWRNTSNRPATMLFALLGR